MTNEEWVQVAFGSFAEAILLDFRPELIFLLEYEKQTPDNN